MNLILPSENWSKYNVTKKTGKDSINNFSFKSEPLVHGEDSMTTIEYFGFPSLHCLLGIVNKLCCELEKRWSGFQEWPSKLYLVRENYFSKTYEVT